MVSGGIFEIGVSDPLYHILSSFSCSLAYAFFPINDLFLPDPFSSSPGRHVSPRQCTGCIRFDKSYSELYLTLPFMHWIRVKLININLRYYSPWSSLSSCRIDCYQVTVFITCSFSSTGELYIPVQAPTCAPYISAEETPFTRSPRFLSSPFFKLSQASNLLVRAAPSQPSTIFLFPPTFSSCFPIFLVFSPKQKTRLFLVPPFPDVSLFTKFLFIPPFPVTVKVLSLLLDHSFPLGCFYCLPTPSPAPHRDESVDG